MKKENGRYIGLSDGGKRVRIPGAFADWPPDDNQPPWNDVTYLRMYTHPDFNYIGYNTIRMYDARLARPEHVNRPLWDRIVGIIPYYQREFNIDGVMIDMGHALPMALKAEMVKKAAAQEGMATFALRVGVVGGGCSGLQYQLDFIKEPGAEDFVSDHHGVSVAVDPFSAGHLAGTIIDYTEGLQGAGFKFNNPNVKSTCGCGSSFSV